tara:strand:- start:443 stop:1570 length:1128 start_codon:yes stop_codon:yes gene_type:complete
MESDGAPFRCGHARDADWRKAAASCLSQIGAPDGRANFGWLYFSDQFAEAAEAILDAFRTTTKVDNWFGCAAIGVCATGHEYFDQPAIVAMLGTLPEDSYRIFASAQTGPEEFADQEAAWLARQLGCFGMVHADPNDNTAFAAMPALAAGCEGFFVGGVTASRGRHAQIAGEIQDGGLTALLLSADIPVSTGLTQGCSPIGEVHEITAADGNILFELDGKPALDVFKADIGDVLARDLNRVSGYIFAALPVRGADWGDYMVRNLTGIDERHGAIAIGDDLSENNRIMFCRRDRATARADMQRMLGEVKRRLSGPPRAAFYHTCLARGANMFDGENAELRMIEEHLGDVPLVGFFGNGEISHNRLYSYTGVLSVIT